MTKSSKIFLTALAGLCLALSGSVYARGPGGNPPPGPAAHAPAPMHYAPPHQPHRGPGPHYHSGSVILGTLATGALIYGIASAINNSTTSVPNTATTTTLGNTASSGATRYVYWCESEQGYYPNVKACPTGWKQMPAP